MPSEQSINNNMCDRLAASGDTGRGVQDEGNDDHSYYSHHHHHTRTTSCENCSMNRKAQMIESKEATTAATIRINTPEMKSSSSSTPRSEVRRRNRSHKNNTQCSDSIKGALWRLSAPTRKLLTSKLVELITRRGGGGWSSNGDCNNIVLARD